MIDLRQYRQFVAVAEEMNFRRAAERLRMAQPPLTAAIRRVEAELGVALLERTNRVERLTRRRRSVPARGRDGCWRKSERAIEQARRAGEGLAGSLRITFVATAAHEMLRLGSCAAFAPITATSSLELQEATTAQQAKALVDDRADIGLVALPLPEWASLNTVSLRRAALVAALPQEHPLASRAKLGLGRSRPRTVDSLLPPALGPGLHRRVVSACARAGFAPQPSCNGPCRWTPSSAFVAAGPGCSPWCRRHWPRPAGPVFVSVRSWDAARRFATSWVIAYAQSSPLDRQLRGRRPRGRRRSRPSTELKPSRASNAASSSLMRRMSGGPS